MISSRAVELLWHRVSRTLGFGHTTTATDETASPATVQVSLNQMETLDRRPIIQHFGLASSMPVGSDVVAMFGSGDRSNGLIIGTSHRPSRPLGLTPGQMTIYDQAGTRILLSNDGNVTVFCGAGGNVRVQGDLHVTGNVVWTCDSSPTDAIGHVHGNVMPGGADTSAPIPGT